VQLHCKIRKGPIEDLVYGTKSIPFQISRDDQMGQSGPFKIQDRKFPIHTNPQKAMALPEYVPIPIRLEKIKLSKNAHDNRKKINHCWNKPLQLPWITKQSTVGKWNKQTFLVMDKLSN